MYIYKIGKYLVYPNGSIYSCIQNKFLKHDIDRLGYHQVTLRLNRKPKRFKVHRLVAMGYVKNPNPELYNQVNHKDGNKGNNAAENLEWCDSYLNNKHARETGLNNISASNRKRWQNEEFAKQTSKKMSIAQSRAHRVCDKNPNNKYLIYENEKMISRQELSEIVGYSLSYTDVLIKKAAVGQRHPIFDRYEITIIDKRKCTDYRKHANAA